jgi:hypothetical protein
MHSAANSRKSIEGSRPSNVILSFFPGIASALVGPQAIPACAD